jgi:hypothetical protein
MEWHWGNIGSALAGLSTVIIAVAALIRSPAVLRDWRDRQRALAEEAREQAETIRLERRRGLSGWSPGMVAVYMADVVSDEAELAQAASELAGTHKAARSVVSHPDRRNRSWRQSTQNRRNDTLTDP